MMTHHSRIVVISNRLPVVLSKTNTGWSVEPGSGGLISALEPLLREKEGVWLGWTGTGEDPAVRSLLRQSSRERNLALEPVFLSEHEKQHFYSGFANQILWPLFHDLPTRCNFDPTFWESYITANQRFAKVAAEVRRPNDLIWVHDYQLMSVAMFLRKLGVRDQLAYFHHIPFPSPDIFEKLPWREAILTSLLHYDVVGFQTPRDRKNFVSCLKRFVKDVELESNGDRTLVRQPGRTTVVGAFPISIDFKAFESLAGSAQAAERAKSITRDLGQCLMVLGLDRLDYTKGIPERLDAFANLLLRFPETHRRVALVQIVVPSREDIPRYAEQKDTVQRKVSEINGRFAEPGWVPIQYIHRAVSKVELAALYRAAHVALVTPLKDGMNLVAKEYCASRVDNDGVLVLSEFAGAAAQMSKGAVIVNPNDTLATADAIHAALKMRPEERRRRMLRLRAGVRRHNVYRWRDEFMACIADPEALAIGA